MKLTALSEIHFAANLMINGGRSEGVATAMLVTRGLQRVASERGRLVIICNGYRDPVRELEYLDSSVPSRWPRPCWPAPATRTTASTR